MRRTASLLILTSTILAMMMVIGACKRATIPVSPAMTTVPTLVQGGGKHTPVGISSETAQQPTSTAVVQVTGLPYPPLTHPTTFPQTGIAYPQPSPQQQPTQQISSPTASLSPSLTKTQPTELQIQATATPTLEPSTSTPELPTPTETETSESGYPPPEVNPYPTNEYSPSYPGPGENLYPTATYSEGYPGPEDTPTTQAFQQVQASPTAPGYPGPSTPTSPVLGTPLTATAPSTGARVPSPTPYAGTPGATPTELPPRPPLSPPPAGSSVTIWHSWSVTETEVLRSVIRSFQRMYPDVTFTLSYVPLDDLYSTYEEAAYLGHGPSLLLGPASWGPNLFKETLVSDLKPFVPANYLDDLIPAGLASGEYQDALISLPLSLHGSVMFRNRALISTPPSTVDDLISRSSQATHGGVVGSYLERGSDLSAAGIIGLGGRMVGEDGYPLFDDALGIQWLDLLAAYDTAGAVTFNTNRDLQMFKLGRVGIIIDNSWNIEALKQAIGADNLAIDPWPAFGSGHMTGWVEADSIFLNANTTDNDRFASLAFMGYLLDPSVQLRLAEVGHIPSVLTTRLRDVLFQQAMEAFTDGVPYPITMDENVLSIYWDELDMAIQAVFQNGSDPEAALKRASDRIYQTIKIMRSVP